ncbi:MAG TPA: hypothetical protein VII40_09545 [Xanthobacteraceae bacterium]
MIAQDDLDADLAAGVAQGIITDAQAAALRALAAEREKARAAALGHEERFRFMRGFNDFFFASGVLLFGAGAAFFAGAAPIANLVAAATFWALAELLVARLRLVLPGLLLVVFLAYFVSLAVPVESWVGGLAHASFAPRVSFLDALGGNPAIGSTRGLLIAIAGLAFFARFRFPFALLPVAGGLVIAVMALARFYSGFIDPHAMLLLCGIIVFAAAMAFDATDRERATRRADCAFWLHLLAAPLIVHSLVWLLAGNAGNAFEAMTGRLAATIIAIVVVLALVAVVIDRRALLVSTLTYLGIVIAYALKTASIDQDKVFFATLLVLGAMVLIIGVAWLPLRRGLMMLVPSRVALRLPPVVSAA